METTRQSYRFRALVKFDSYNHPTIFEGDFDGVIDSDENPPIMEIDGCELFQRAFYLFKEVIRDRDGEIITILDVKLRHTSDVIIK